MTTKLNWVRGNSVLMTVTLKQVNTDGTKTAIDLSTYDSWEAKVLSVSAFRKDDAGATAALNPSGEVVLSIPATLPCGTYSVEVTCSKDLSGGGEAYRRSYETPVFRVVENNGEASVTYDVVECQLSADIEMEFQLTPMATQLGQNAYEMWKELPGNEGKTLQDFIEEVLDLDGITADCIAATEDAEAAAVIGSHPDYIGEDNYVYHWSNGAYVKTDIYCKGDPGTGGEVDWDDITDKPTFATVATSGSYNDLSNKPTIPDVSGKADKVSSATNGNFASLDSNGNLTDSGHKHSDYLTSHQDISGKADKVTSATNGNFAALDSNGNLTDSGHKHSDYLTSHQDLSNYVQKSNTAGLLKNDGTIDTSTYLTSQLYTSAYCYSGSNERYKKAYCSGFSGFRDYGYIQMIIAQGNGCNADFYISINESGSKRVYIDGVASSSTNYNLQSGSYIVYFDQNGYYFNTDGTIPKVIHTSSTSGLVKNDGTIDTSTYLTSSTAHQVPAGGNAGQVLKKSSATDYDYTWANQTQDYPSAYCKTAAGTAGKTAACTLWTATANTYLHLVIVYANTSASALTLNVNSTSAATIYINGVVSSSTNYTLPAGSYIAFYDGTYWYINTDGTIPNVATTSSVSSKADKVVVVDASTPPASLDPNKIYQFGTLTGTVTIPAFSSVASGDTEAKIWCFTFDTSSTAPTITWPAAITSWVGGSAPTINASKSYEVTVMDGIGAIMEA